MMTIATNPREFVWEHKYRPNRVVDTILPVKAKTAFANYLEQGDIPNLLLEGPPGIGKTTSAKALVEELGGDVLVINASMNGNIDTLRTDIMQFASTVSFSGGRKYVILDEADNLNPQSTQPALRSFMDEFSKNCGFIMTANYPLKIIEPLRSRLVEVDFRIPNAEKPKLAQQFFKRVAAILTEEGVEFEPKVVAEVLNRHFPDLRKVLNALQKYSANSGRRIDEGVLSAVTGDLDALYAAMKAKKLGDVRKWVADNSDIDSTTLYRQLYDTLTTHVKGAGSIANSILVLAEYEYKEAFVANTEINRVAALVTLMSEISDWK